jgi:hypothetical protein
LALVVGFIPALITIIGGVLRSTLISILDWYITSVAKPTPLDTLFEI